jgi:hypothetical protein
VDTWWGLKAGRDGGNGLDVYVFGGRKLDLPLNAGDGALIADVLCEHRVSMVLSVKHLSGRERSGFMVAFAQTLFQKWGGGPLHLVLEEAHEFAPQMGGSRGNQSNTDNEAAMLGAFKRLWKLGRSSGIGGSAITQRPASLSKDITTQSEILIAHRTIGPQDVRAIGEWVKYHGERLDILAELPSLPTGETFVWAPEFPEEKPIGLQRTTVLLRDTYDSASTPKVGEKRVEPKELAPVDLERLRAKISATIEKAKADDPRELKKQIAELKKELAAKVSVAPSNERSTPVLTEAERALLKTVAEEFRDFVDSIADRADRTLTSIAERARSEIEKVAGEWTTNVEKRRALFLERLEQTRVQKVLDKLTQLAPNTHAPLTPRVGRQVPVSPHARRVPPVAATSRPVRVVASSSKGDLRVTPARQKILNGLAFLHGIGVAPADKTQLALIVGVSPTSGGYFNNLGSLRSAGLIEYPSGGAAALTAAGAAIASTDGIPSTTDELHNAIRAKLPAAKWKILEALIPIYPKALHKDDLAEKIGVQPTSGGYFNNLGSLRSLGLIDYPQPGHAAARAVLFLD